MGFVLLTVLLLAYALLGLAWEPLITADAHYRLRYPCDDALPWAWVMTISWLAVAVALVVGIVRLVMRRPRRDALLLIGGAALVWCTSLVVGAVAVRYVGGSCPARPLR
jgi:hypothetical protein